MFKKEAFVGKVSFGFIEDWKMKVFVLVLISLAVRLGSEVWHQNSNHNESFGELSAERSDAGRISWYASLRIKSIGVNINVCGGSLSTTVIMTAAPLVSSIREEIRHISLRSRGARS